GVQYGLPACRVARGARAGPRERPAEVTGRSTGAALPVRARGRSRAARHLACPGHAWHGDLPFRRKRRFRARGAHGSPGRRSAAGHWTALSDTTALAVRLG